MCSMKPEDLAQFQIPLPPLEVQKEIVAEIEGYQKVIDGARAVLDNYRPHIPIHPDWPMVELAEACHRELEKSDTRRSYQVTVQVSRSLQSDACEGMQLIKIDEFILDEVTSTAHARKMCSIADG